MSKDEVLYHLLVKERAYYMQLLELTEMEAGQLERNRPLSEILPNVKKRQIIMSCIEDIEKAIIPLKRHWENKGDKSDSESSRVLTLVTELDQLIQNILQKDQENQKLFEKRMKDLSTLEA